MNTRFAENAFTSNNRVKAFSLYVLFHIKITFKKSIIHKGIGNIKFLIHKGDAGLVGNIYFGVYEMNESLFTAHFLRENDFFLDIGDNLGHYSLIATGLSGANSVAIEPVPSTYNKLLLQIKINNFENKITALNIGLSYQKSKLFFSSNNGVMNHIVDENHSDAIQINVDTLDNIAVNKSFKLIKIDVEGYEKFVFDGGKNTLKDNNLKALIVELNNSGQRYKISDNELHQILLNQGFKPYEYNGLTRELLKLDSYNKKQFNTIFIRYIEFVKRRVSESKKHQIWGKYL